MLTGDNFNRYFKISNIRVNREYGVLIISLDCKIRKFTNKSIAYKMIDNLTNDILDNSNLRGIYSMWYDKPIVTLNIFLLDKEVE